MKNRAPIRERGFFYYKRVNHFLKYSDETGKEKKQDRGRFCVFDRV